MKTFRRLLKGLTALMMIGVILLTNAQSVAAANGRNQYFLSFLFSPETKSFGSITVQNTGMSKKEDVYSQLNTSASMFMLTVKNDGLNIVVDGAMLLGDGISTYSSLSHRPYTFPEYGDVDGRTVDFTMANKVGSDLGSALNLAVKTILKPVSTDGFKELNIDDAGNYFKLVSAISNCGYQTVKNQSTQNCNYGELEWTMRPATEADMKTVKVVSVGSTTKDYVVVINHSNKSVVVPYLIPKGYNEGQELFGSTITSIDSDTITSKLSWGHVVYMSARQLSMGSTLADPGVLEKEDAFTKMISSFFGSLVSKLNNFLGIYSPEELMFNAGNRGASYYFGIMPIN
ncbi:MAG: hypothetical protein AB9921_02490 [Erysipelotrichaceae bacterium]